ADGTVVEPGVFIPLAERTQLIGQLGSWVLREGCRTARHWKTRDGEPLPLSVNVSPHQITATFAASVRQALEQTGVRANQLELEITESALIGNASVDIG